MIKFLTDKVSAAFARASERPVHGAAVLCGIVVLSAVTGFFGFIAAVAALTVGAYVKPKIEEPTQPETSPQV